MIIQDVVSAEPETSSKLLPDDEQLQQFIETVATWI
jgi:hypothetical protein